MNTWQLWRRIIRPPQDSVIYHRALHQAGPPIPWYIGCVEIFAFVLVAPMIAFIGPVYSFGWVIGIGGDIARARENGRLDLLALTPAGPLGASFAVAVATLHREGALVRISQRSTWAGRITALVLVLYVSLLAPRLAAGEPIATLFIAAALLIAALYPDQFQSVALACTCGMLAAEVSDNRSTAQWLGFLLLLALQAGIYGAALSLFIVLTPAGVDERQQVVAVLAALLTLLVSREALFLLLWRALANRFGAATVLDLASAHRV